MIDMRENLFFQRQVRFLPAEKLGTDNGSQRKTRRDGNPGRCLALVRDRQADDVVVLDRWQVRYFRQRHIDGCARLREFNPG